MLQCKLCIQYFINFSLSLSLFFVCVHPSLLQIHPTLPNHHSITTTTTHHNSSQPMIFQSQNQPKTKENETKNQSKPKIKPSMENSTTQNPKSNFQQKTHQPKPKSKPSLSPLPWRACCFFAHGKLVVAMREERNKCLRATAKEKIKKKKKREKRSWERKQRTDGIL